MFIQSLSLLLVRTRWAHQCGGKGCWILGFWGKVLYAAGVKWVMCVVPLLSGGAAATRQDPILASLGLGGGAAPSLSIPGSRSRPALAQ